MQSLVCMTAKRVVYISEAVCIYKNLMIEDYLLHNTPKEQYCLLFYRNTDSVVIGRNQSFFTEVNFPALHSNQRVCIARRMSGGGAVFHDLGNVNYSLIMPRDQFDRRQAAQMVCDALLSVNKNVHVNERNDICMSEYKISGSAYRIVRERAYHHGTMLLSSDLGKLRTLLRSPVEILERPSVCSVTASVANLTPHLEFEEFIDRVIQEFDSNAPIIRISSDIHVDTNQMTDPKWKYMKGSPHTFKYKNNVYRLEDGILLKNDSPMDIDSFLKEHQMPTEPVLA